MQLLSEVGNHDVKSAHPENPHQEVEFPSWGFAQGTWTTSPLAQEGPLSRAPAHSTPVFGTNPGLWVSSVARGHWEGGKKCHAVQ